MACLKSARQCFPRAGIAGLATAIGIAFLAACWALNGRDAFTHKGSPAKVPLFALGGVYGHARGARCAAS